MTLRKFLSYFRFGAVALAVSVASCAALHAQAPMAPADMDAPSAFVEATTPSTPTLVSSDHRFWDKQNCALLAAAAALNGADFAVTRANLQSGGQELNPLVRVFGRSSEGLAVNFVGETVGVITLSYFFHRAGHHRLERAVSMFDIGTTAGAVSYGSLHR
jgi:hypothetical protein